MTPGDPATTVRRSWRARVTLTIVVAGALAAAAGWWLFRTPTAVIEPGWAGTALVIAGDGMSGFRDGPASQARFSDPFGVAVAADGTVFVSDAGEANRIRRIGTDGFVSTIAGGRRGFADGRGHEARFDTPSGLAIDATGTLYVVDTGNNAIRRITPDGQVSTVAGDGVAGYRDGPGYQARFNGPIGLAVDRTGRVIVADTYNDRIRAIGPDGTVTILAGSAEPGLLDDGGSQARFDTPCGVAIDDTGTIHVADTGNGLVRRIDLAGAVTTAPVPFPEDIRRPLGIAAGPSGDVYVADEGGTIVEISATGATRTLAGSGPGFRDGTGRDARFRRPAGVAFAARGRLIVADAGNALVRLLAAPALLDLRPPASSLVAPRFDADSFRLLPLLWPIAPMEGPHEVAGTLGEVRGDGPERFHSGIDVRVEDGTLVRAVRDGVVSSPLATDGFGTLNESMRLGPVAYVHIRVGRTRSNEVLDIRRFVPTFNEEGKLVRMRVKRGARFTTGEAIATVNRFNHVHLNVGWSGEEYNPLEFRLARFEDTVPPTIPRAGVRLFDEYGQPITKRARRRLIVSGRVQIVVDAWDQADGTRPGRRLGLYALGYQVLNRDGSPAPGFDTLHETIRFERLVSDPDGASRVYASGSGIPFYGRRTTRFLYIVTNTLRDGVSSEGFWDTTRLAPGDYTLRVRASDVAGNAATRDLDVAVAPSPYPATLPPPR
jgi:sugar lactone lactonase YvrE